MELAKRRSYTTLDLLQSDLASHTTVVELEKRMTALSVGPKLGFYIAYMHELAASEIVTAGTPFGGKYPALDGQTNHLEHIMPKNVIKASGWKVTYTDEEAKAIVSRWGNFLVLPSGTNKSIQDKAISIKMSAYAGCSYELTKPARLSPFLKSGDWTAASIAEREAELAKSVSPSAWPLT